MIYDRMSDALRLAATEQSEPKQFSLSHEDFASYVAGTHPLKLQRGTPPRNAFDGVAVVRASLEAASSVLHVLGTRATFENPIRI